MDGQQTRRSGARWSILLLISLMYLITYLDRVNISTAMPEISKEFGFDKITTGAIFSAFLWSYALFQVPGGQPSLRTVGLEDAKLGPAVPLAPTSGFTDCELAPYSVIAAGSKVAIFAGFGLKSDGFCNLAGGYLLADPDTGAVLGRFAPAMHFRQMVSNDDGRYLYGLDVGDEAWKTVRIVKLDAATGNLITERVLEPDVWYLASGTLAR